MPKQLLEHAALKESVDKKSGKILVDIVTPGIGSSGYYSPEVCEAAAGLVTAGTQMFIDHPTDAEAAERPIRSVKDIAAVFTESARWDPNRGDAGSLVAEARVVPAWIETMGVIQGAIGVSLRGSATDIVEGDIDGRPVPIVEGLHSIDSVDFVTRAGRGGAFSLLESANPQRVRQRAVAHGVSEATVNDTREALQSVLRDAYGGEKTYVWVRDFDETTVWFEVEDGDASGVYGQAYTSGDNGAVSLTGDRTEVRVRTEYVPVNTNPAGPSNTNPTTEADQEVTMGNIQVDEAEHRRVTEAAGRVPELEKELATEKERGDVAEAKLAQRDVRDVASKRATEAVKDLHPAVAGRVVESVTRDIATKDDGSLDEPKFDEAVKTAIESETKYLEQLTPSSGGLHGFGASDPNGSGVAESAPTTTPWGRPLSESNKNGA